MSKKKHSDTQLNHLRQKLSALEKREAELKETEEQLKALNQQLKDSEQKYRSIVDSISDGVFILDSDKLIIRYLNKTAEDLLGRKAEEVMGKPLFEAFPEAKGSVFETKYREAYEKKSFVSFETYFGIEPYLNWYDVRVYPGENGISVFFQVISEKKQMELDLKRARDFLNETARTGKIGGWQFDPVTLKQTWTDEVFRILEIDTTDGAPEVPQGLGFIDPEFRQTAEKAVQRAMELGEPYDQEWVVTTSRGNKKWVNAVCKPKMENGKVISVSGSFQDINARKKAEIELKESEERLRTVLDNSPFPVAVVDENDQNIKYWSKSAIEMFGHNPRTTAEWYELAYPDPEYRNKVIERWKPLLDIARDSSEAINTGEYNITCKNGTVKICELHAQFIPGNLLVTLNDITEKKKSEARLTSLNQQLQANEQQLRAANQQLQANEQQLRAANQQLQANEQQLRASNQQLQANEQQLRAANQQLNEAKQEAEENEAMLKAAMENSQAGIAIAEVPSGKLTYVNKAGLLIRDKDYDEIVKNIDVEKYVESWQILHLDGSPYKKDEVPLAKAVLYGESSSKEFIVRRDNNEDRYVWANAAPVLNEEGKQIAAIVVFLDITEKKLAEQRILKNQYYLTIAQEIGKVGTWELDLIKNQLFWTDETYKIFGVPTGTRMTYESFLDCVHPEDRSYVNKEWKASMKSKTYDIEHRLLVDEQVKWVREKADFKFDNKGNIIKAIGLTQDITEQKSYEQELQQSFNSIRMLTRHTEEIREKERHRIARDLHDDLGQVLSGAKIEISLIKNDSSVESDKIKTRLNTTQSYIDKALHSIQRITAGLRPPILDNLGLLEALNQLTMQVQQSSRLEIISEMPEKEPEITMNIKIIIYRIIQEVVTNILRHARATRINLSIREKDTLIYIQVNDNGIGIKPESIESPESFGIMGMRERVQALNGTFEISSHDGTGTSVNISLPAEQSGLVS